MIAHAPHLGHRLRAGRREAFFLIVAFSIPILYALYTRHVWEDFFITFKFSKNLVEGYGLVYHPGEKVHGFTSVINTLLPSLFYSLTQSLHPYLGALWLYRIASAVAYAIAGVLVFGYLRRTEGGPAGAALFAVLFLLEIKTVAFTANGQEAGFMLLFLLPALIYAFEDVDRHWKLVGACWAGLLYTRPDAVVYIAAVSASLLCFSQERGRAFAALLKAGALGASIYLPWLVFAWWYYGSPVPHTVVAKSAYSVGQGIEMLELPGAIVHVLASIYAPIYHEFGGWPAWVHWFSLALGGMVSVYWAIPSDDRFGRFVSLFFSLMVVYLVFLAIRGGVFPWYLPPTAAAGLIVLSRGLARVLARLRVRRIVSVSFSGAVAVAFFAIFAMSVHQLRIQQREIELGNRARVGAWLEEHVEAGERIFLEPLGYIGFFSDAKMLDYPGLVSPEVVEAIRAAGRARFAPVIQRLEPEWLVLRPHELDELTARAGLAAAYEPAAVFDARERLRGYRYIPGRGYPEFDSVFVVMRRR